MKKLIWILFIVTTSCSEILKEECRITGRYKDYNCPEGFEKISDFIQLNVNIYFNIDTCTQLFVNGRGCAFVINDSNFLNEIVKKYEIEIPKEDSIYWNLNTHTILGFKEETNIGSEIYDSIFLCVNQAKEEYILRCQYEISDQCAGSDIYPLLLFKIISTPKLKSEYTVEFDIEDVNPFKY